MKRLIIIIAVLLMLTGGAISAMKAMQLGPFALKNGDESQEKTTAKAAPKGEPMFVEMAPLFVPILAGDRVVATVRIQVKIETHGIENQSFINKNLVRLGDAFLSDLYVFLPRLIERQETIDVTIVRQRLEMVVGRALGKGLVDAILIQSLTNATPPVPSGG